MQVGHFLNRKNDRLVLCDDDRVLELSRDRAVDRPQRPAIPFFENVTFASGEERFNG